MLTVSSLPEMSAVGAGKRLPGAEPGGDTENYEEYEDGHVDYTHHEYEFKFCPECGARVKGGDTK